MAPILELVLPSMRTYAERHGYELVLGTGHEAPGRPLSWARIPLFESLLDTYAEVLWIDADVAILDQSVDIASTVSPGAYMALAKQPGFLGGDPFPNCGVWYLRDAPKTRALLRALWDQEAFVDHPWWENAALIDLLGYQVDSVHEPVRKIRSSGWEDGIAWLEETWNSLVSLSVVERPRFRHYSSMPNWRRDRMIRADLGLPAPTLARRLTVDVGRGVRFAAAQIRGRRPQSSS